MRRLYLHIGAHRTATSSIQRFLFQNAADLPARGFLYPFGVRRHVALMADVERGGVSIRRLAAMLQQAAAEAGGVPNVILSDEDVCTWPSLAKLGKLAEDFDLRVIFSLRRQDLWLESWYLQNVKWQWNPALSHVSFDVFMARRAEFHWIDYAARIAHLEEVFGRDRLLLSVFERDRMPGGPVAHFCRQVGLSMDGLAPPEHRNASRSPLVSEFMRHLPLDRAGPRYRAHLEEAFQILDERVRASALHVSDRLLSHDERLAILEAHAEGNAWVARRHFGREALFLDPLPPPDAPLAQLRLPADSATLMRELVAPFVAALIEINPPRTRGRKAAAEAAPARPGRQAGLRA